MKNIYHNFPPKLNLLSYILLFRNNLKFSRNLMNMGKEDKSGLLEKDLRVLCEAIL